MTGRVGWAKPSVIHERLLRFKPTGDRGAVHKVVANNSRSAVVAVRTLAAGGGITWVWGTDSRYEEVTDIS